MVLSYDQFTVVTQKRAKIMMDVTRLAQQEQQRNNTNTINNSPIITQKGALYILSSLWDAKDTFHREMIDQQVEMHFHLAGSLVDQLACLWIDPVMEEEYEKDCDTAAAAALTTSTRDALDTTDPVPGGPVPGDPVPDPRALGLISKYATEDMNKIKDLILLALSRALQLSVLMGDEIGIQNAIVHFWNLHIHIFRKNLCVHAVPKVYEFLRQACDALQSQSQIFTLYQSMNNKKGDKVVKSVHKGTKGSPRGGPVTIPLGEGNLYSFINITINTSFPTN